VAQTEFRGGGSLEFLVVTEEDRGLRRFILMVFTFNGGELKCRISDRDSPGVHSVRALASLLPVAVQGKEKGTENES
jgi:hypothetical protein